MRKYEINGVTVEVIREESVSNNYTIFSRLTSLLNSLKNEDEFLNKDGACKDNKKDPKT